MTTQNNKWYDFYNYDSNEDLIIKLCNKFDIKTPNTRYNCYGGVDVSFINGLKEYLVELDTVNQVFVIKRKDMRKNGQKQTKNYMNICKKIKNGSWYQVIKWIKKDSTL